jgi:hypothetical protein
MAAVLWMAQIAQRAKVLERLNHKRAKVLVRLNHQMVFVQQATSLRPQTVCHRKKKQQLLRMDSVLRFRRFRHLPKM